MKRSPFLRELSREHHTALSIANRIAKTTTDGARALLADSVIAEFQDKIEPHFRQEEDDLLVRLAAVGETVLVERTLAEHRQLRALAARLAGGDGAALTPLGQALRDHVRFEERELFAAAEMKLA